MVSKRSRATDISKKTRDQINQRDQWCIFCGTPYNLQIAHFIPRSSGGLGQPHNLARACIQCHTNLDQSTHRKEMLRHFEKHLRKFYPDFDNLEFRYKK